MGDAFVVSTCNRTEIYTTTHNYMFVAQLFCETVGVQLMDFMQFVTVKKERTLWIIFSELRLVWKAKLLEILRLFLRSKMPTTVSKNTNYIPMHIWKEQLTLLFRYQRE